MVEFYGLCFIGCLLSFLGCVVMKMFGILQIPVLDVSFAQHVVEALRGVMRWPLGHGDVVQAYRFLSIPRGTNIDMV